MKKLHEDPAPPYQFESWEVGRLIVGFSGTEHEQCAVTVESISSDSISDEQLCKIADGAGIKHSIQPAIGGSVFCVTSTDRIRFLEALQGDALAQ